MVALLFSLLLTPHGIPAQNEQSSPVPIQTRLGPVYPPTRLPADEDPRYFLDGTFNEFTGRPAAYDFTERFCAWYLRSMKEPSLLGEPKQENVKVYRFLKLPPYFHPWSVRITILPDGSGQAVVKSTSGTGGFSPGHLTTVQTVEVPGPTVEHFLGLVDRSGFWSMPATPPLPAAQPGRRKEILK